jgi:hypothetical protein
MHTNHDTDLMTDWDLSQLRDEDDEQDQEQEPEQEYSGDLPW